MLTALHSMHFLTREGLRRFQKEFNRLKEKRIEKVHEDAEGREDLDLIEKRMRDIAEILHSYELIKLPPKNKRDEVHLGALVHVGRSDGREVKVRLVGMHESNPLSGRISHKSPLGQALFGCRVGDTVELGGGRGVAYTVRKIEYGSTRKV